MHKIEGKLSYNDENKRFDILVSDLWEDSGLHCGETLEVFLNGEWKADRIEMGNEWYLVYSKLRGDELEGLEVRK